MVGVKKETQKSDPEFFSLDTNFWQHSSQKQVLENGTES